MHAGSLRFYWKLICTLSNTDWDECRLWFSLIAPKAQFSSPYFYSWVASFEFAELNHYKSKISNKIMILWSILIMQLWILHCPVALLQYTKNFLNFAFSKNNMIWILPIISDLRAFDRMEIIMFNHQWNCIDLPKYRTYALCSRETIWGIAVWLTTVHSPHLVTSHPGLMLD